MNTNWKRNILLFLTSQGITLLGSSIVQLAIIWHVTLTTSSGIWITILTLCSFIPQMIVAPVAGVFADRYSRKLLIILADGLIAIATFGLLLFLMFVDATYHLQGIIIISILRSIGSGLQAPAVNATIPTLVPEASLLKFNGINSSLQSAIQFLSPALSGFILSISNINTILLIDIITAVIGMILLMIIQISKTQQIKQYNNDFWIELKGGFSYIKQMKMMFKMFKTYSIYIFLSVPSGFLITLFVERYFKNGYTYLSIIEVIGFLGMFIGGILFTTYKKPMNLYKVFSMGIICYGVVSILLGFTSEFWIFGLLMFFLSFFIPIVQSVMITYLQENTKPEFLGRIFSVLSAIFSGVMPLGMIIFGPLADFFSMRGLFIICGFAITCLGLFSFSSFKKRGEIK